MFARALEVDHRELDGLYAAALEPLNTGDAAAALDRVDLFWARLAIHIRAEHLHLFPAISQTPGNADVISRLREDHNIFMDRLAEAMKLLRAASENRHADLSGPKAILLSIGEMLLKHNRIEEATIYVDAGEMSGAEQDELVSAIDKELNNLPPRFSGAAK